jgi:hypothetical protein
MYTLLMVFVTFCKPKFECILEVTDPELTLYLWKSLLIAWCDNGRLQQGAEAWYLPRHC